MTGINENFQNEKQGLELSNNEEHNGMNNGINTDNFLAILENMQTKITDLEHFLQQIRDRFDDSDKLFLKINDILYQLRVLDIQMKIIIEIVGNCINFPTQMLQELKQRVGSSFAIKCESRDQINTVFVLHILDLLDNCIVRRLGYLKKYNNEQSCKFHEHLLFETRVVCSELIMIVRSFALAVDSSKDDLLCLPVSHPRWQAILAVRQVKRLADALQMQKSYYAMMKSLRVGHALIFKKNNYKSSLMRFAVFCVLPMWYMMMDERARLRAISHTSTMQSESAIQVMNLLDMPGIRHLYYMTLQPIKMNTKVYIGTFVEPFSVETIQKELKNGTINKVTHQPLQLVNQMIHEQITYNDLIKNDPSKIRIRILCGERIQTLNQGYLSKILSILTKHQVYETIIIHIHGGGFVSMSSGTHQNYTREWANKLKVPVFSIDYGLAPQNPYPSAVNDCWQAYNWILQSVHKYMKDVKPKRVILAGDSAGGNLCCAIAGLAIKYGVQVPNGIYLAYPVLDIRFSCSPSYQLSFKDSLITHRVLDIVIQAYSGQYHSQNSSYDTHLDPFLSPSLLSDDILKQFPPVRIAVGDNDPLKDHSFRFVSRLIDNGINTKLVIYEELSHGFLSFFTFQGMKEVATCIKDSIEFIQELVDLII